MKKSKITNKKSDIPQPTEALKVAVQDSFDQLKQKLKSNSQVNPILYVNFEWIRKVAADGSVTQEEFGGFTVDLEDKLAVDARQYLLNALGRVSAMFNLVGIAGSPIMVRLVSTAWMSEQKVKNKKLKLMRPSEDPNRKEVILSVGMEPSRAVHGITASIKGEKFNLPGEVRASILHEFYNAYDIALPSLQAEGSYRHLKPEALENPQKTFDEAIELSFAAAMSGMMRDLATPPGKKN